MIKITGYVLALLFFVASCSTSISNQAPTIASSEDFELYGYEHSSERVTDQPSGDRYFDNIDGVYVDTSGYIYVVDRENNRVQKWDANANYIGWIGGGVDGWHTGTGRTAARGDRDFNRPNSVVVATDGTVYVGDHSAQRVQKWSSDGTYQGWIGWMETGWQTGVVDICSCDNCPGRASPSFIIGATGMALDNANNIYIAGYTSYVMKWNLSTGAFRAFIGRCHLTPQTTYTTSNNYHNNNACFKYAADVTVSDNWIYTTDRGNHRIHRWELATGNYNSWIGWGQNGWRMGRAPIPEVDSYGNNGQNGNALFDGPWGIVADNNANGYLYIVDTGNARIQRWTKAGTYSGWIGHNQEGWVFSNVNAVSGCFNPLPCFSNPEGIAYHDDHLYVTNLSGWISKWHVNGNFVGRFGEGVDGWRNNTNN